MLTVSNPVNVELEDFPGYDSSNAYTTNDYTWVQFTAPAYGEYSFYGSRSYQYCYGDKSASLKPSAGNWVNNLRLEEGQKIYFKVYGTFTLKVD